MDPAHIAELLAPFLQSPPGLPALLTGAQLEQVSAYLDLLLRWNARINLTAVRDAESMVTRHFGESLFAARLLLAPESRCNAIDLGSGAGFPGLPLKIWAPSIHLTLVEAHHKKAAFLREVTRALTLTDVDVLAVRAETLLATPPHPDVVTFRAVERFASILPTAAGFAAPTGRLAILIGASQADSLSSLTPNLDWLPPIAIPQSQSRVLSIGVHR